MKTRNLLTGIVWATLAVCLACSGPSPDSREEPDQRPKSIRVRALLARGAAHAGIVEWPEAIAAFQAAEAIAPAEPTVHFNLALCHLRSGDLEAARAAVAQIAASSPNELRARASLLESEIALESGLAEVQEAAVRRAIELDPNEAAYAYTLSRLVPRGGDEFGQLLAAAHSLWPDNRRLGAELAQWMLQSTEPGLRMEAVVLLEQLTAGSARPQLPQMVDRGRAELEADPQASRVPVTLRQAINLLRPGKKFQEDSARLESRLALTAFATPSGADLELESAGESPRITLEPTKLLPDSIMSAELVDVVTCNDVPGSDPGVTSREADLAFLATDSVSFLPRAEDVATHVANVEEGFHHLLAGELDGDGKVELIAFGEGGLQVWTRSSADGTWSPPVWAASLVPTRLLDAILVDFEHDGDLDLLGLDPDGNVILILHRGEAGWGGPVPAPLPITGPFQALHSSDLDADADQDLLFAGPTEIVLLRNWRQGEFALEEGLDVPEVRSLETLDYNSDGAFDLVAATGGRLAWFVNRGNARLEEDPAANDIATGLAQRIDAQRVVPADLDLDGDLDLVVQGRATGDLASVAGLENTGHGTWRVEESMAPTLGPIPAGLLVSDLDGDLAPDIAAWGKEGLVTFTSRGAENQSRIQIELRGLAGKVPLDGRGARVQIVTGAEGQWLELDQPLVTVGLGQTTASVIKVTWPNGISEYVFQPDMDSPVIVEQVLRIEGSCPFVYASNGESLAFVTDILGLSPLGMLAAPGRYVEPDPEEYLRLPDWVAENDGAIELAVTEELREVAYLDQFELVVVDTPPGVIAYNGERWLPRPVKGLDLRLMGPLTKPASVLDHEGRSVIDTVARLDGVYASPPVAERLYQGAMTPYHLTVALPARVAAAPRPTLVLEGWLHWGNTSTNVARAQDPGGAPAFPRLEVPGADGTWHSTNVEVGLPAGKTKPIVVDLAGVLNPADPRVRIVTDFEVHWDRIAAAIGFSGDFDQHHIQALPPTTATLDFGGFSKWYRPAPNGPYQFDRTARRSYPWRDDHGARPVPISWQEHEGWYTAFGSVRDLLLEEDDRLAVIGSGDEIFLRFETDLLPSLRADWTRTYFLHTQGWEKDGDPNVSCSQTVDPLPSRHMQGYPCETTARAVEPGKGIDLNRQTRWVSRDRLESRVVALSGDGE